MVASQRPPTLGRIATTLLLAVSATLAQSLTPMAAGILAQVTDEPLMGTAAFSAQQLAELDRRIGAEMEASNIPGVVVGVASRGRLVHWKGYGLANVELNVPATDSTVWEIGSISKEFVSATVMLLVEEGRLKLDDPINKYLTGLPSEWLGVTIRQLLTHTSGIPDYEEIQTYEAYRFRFTPEEIIRVAHSRPMDFVPGTGYYYSNTGYFLLSLMVERIEGRPLGQVLQARIFGPLGMTQTRMADPERIISHRAAGYYIDGNGKLVNRDATQVSSTLGAGGIVSTVHDMVKWDQALYGTELLSEASKEAMWTPVVLPDGTNTHYGFGWRRGEFRGRWTVGHSGMVAGFVANFLRIPEEEVAIIVFANRYRVSSSRLRDAVLESLFPES